MSEDSLRDIINKIKKKHPGKLVTKLKESPNYYIYTISDLNFKKSGGLYLNAIKKSNGQFTILDLIIDNDEISKAVDVSNVGAFDIKVGDINVDTK